MFIASIWGLVREPLCRGLDLRTWEEESVSTLINIPGPDHCLEALVEQGNCPASSRPIECKYVLRHV